MKAGDILLIRSKYDPVAWLIRKVTKSEWNHVAWAINSHWLIEARGSGITMSSIRHFQNDRWKLKLIRVKDLSKSKIAMISRLLRDQICKWNHLTFLLTYLLTILGLKYRPCKSCAWFVAESMRKADYNLVKSRDKYVCPEDFNRIKTAIDVTDEIQYGVKTKKLTRKSK